MINSRISLNHQELKFSGSFADHLNEIASDFMNTFKLSHAFIGKSYFDGRYMDICNDLSWKKIMVSSDYYKEFAKGFMLSLKAFDRKPLFFTWQMDPNRPTPLLEHFRQHNSVVSGFNIMMINEDHIENYGFGSSRPLLEVCNNLPSRKELEMFCLYLREEILMSPALRNPIFGNTGQPFKPQSANKYNHIRIPNNFSFLCNDIDSKLSRREVICLGLIARGYGQKDIARIMKIAPRTVEFHFTQIKTKYNNPAKAILITDFNNSPLGNIDPLLLRDSL